LRSAQTGAVVAGLIVEPRFGWSGTGSIMSEVGWSAGPQFLDIPLVPGSGRQIPPWVLAGPVILRLQELLAALKPTYSIRQETRAAPRGRVLWPQYISNSLAKGTWGRLPCQFSDLGLEVRLRGYVRWAMEKLRLELNQVGRGDSTAAYLSQIASKVLMEVNDAPSRKPRSAELELSARSAIFSNEGIARGLQALGWIADERGLGGGQESDGLAWFLPLEVLWERYVESTIRREVAREGGDVSVGRLGQTVFPFQWKGAVSRSMTHLVPDMVVRSRKGVRIIDAKYKAHFADLDESSWFELTKSVRESHRADIHQILAYAGLYESKNITASLIYPLRKSTWENLKTRHRDVAVAELVAGGRQIRLELRGIPFGLT